MMDELQPTQPPLFREGVLSILIPVYNERAYLRKCVERVLAVKLPRRLQKEIILVDDASTDGTRDVVDELQARHPQIIRPLHQTVNQGKGAAIRRAVQEMTGQYAIIQDADLEYDPQDYAVMLEPILEGLADVVYGSRFASRTMRRVLFYHHALGNKLLTHLSNFTTGLDLTDMETCYKAFRANVLKTIPIRSNRFGMEPEITAKIAKRGCVVYEVPISYRGRSYAEGKKINWKDGVSALYTIVKYWIRDDCFDECYGTAILQSLSKARRFNEWIAKVIQPFLGARILEIGAGIGNISRFLPKREKLIVTDMDPVYLELLNDAFGDNDLVEVAKLDVTCDADFAALGQGICDTVVCLNVLEHIEDDRGAVRRMKNLLVPGGLLILLVPQHEWLYGSYDRHVGHYRRYNRSSLAQVLADSGLEIVRLMNFNFLSIPGWWINSCLFKRSEMDRWQLKIYDMLVPIMKPLERLLPLPGLSVIAVARKPATAGERPV
jgi:glycosyltransferase involved in cell wall biosynthesis